VRSTTVPRGIIVTAFTLTFYPVVKAFTLGQIQVWINALFALALLAWMLGLKASSDRVLDFCTMGLSATVASPIAWEHHYGILLPIFSVLLLSTLRDRRQFMVLIVSYVFAANFLPAAQLMSG